MTVETNGNLLWRVGELEREVSELHDEVRYMNMALQQICTVVRSQITDRKGEFDGIE